jgi:type VI secretion system secreted protein Hcp
MAVDIFIKIGDIKGESVDERRPDWIEVESFSWGAINQLPAVQAAAPAGKVSFQDLHFVQRVNKASPLLMQAVCTGEHIPDATLAVARKAGEKQQDYLIVKLTDVLVSSYQTGGSSGGDVPIEQVSLNFSKIVFQHIAEDGSQTEAASCPSDPSLRFLK